VNYPAIYQDLETIVLYAINSVYANPSLSWYDLGTILGDMQYEIFQSPPITNPGGVVFGNSTNSSSAVPSNNFFDSVINAVLSILGGGVGDITKIFEYLF
jgi:hypothetical protein